MAKEFSAGAVVFRRAGSKPLYLLLHYHFKGDYWDFPRGNIERGETAQQAAAREIKEETGLDYGKGDIEFVDGFKEKTSWFYRLKGQNIFKQATYFLAEAKKKDVKLSEEHLEYKWLEFDAAVAQLTYDNSKSVLKKADEFLRKREEGSIKKFLRQK